jgi:hypothetical protein
MSDTSTQATEPAADLRRAEVQRREYGRYRAAGPIRVDGALAFRKGDPVPISHVERGIVARTAVEEFEKGEGPAAILEPSDDAPDPLAAFLDRDAKDVIADVGSLSPAEQTRAVTLEEAGRDRVTVLRALGRVEATTTATNPED